MLFTIGHGTKTIDEFVSALKTAGVTSIIDVRTLPGSTKFPHFNEENMQEWLPEAGISYTRAKDLGGLRGKTAGVDKSVNAFWENVSFHRYADYAMGESFNTALLRLLDLAKNSDVAVMCAESVWWRCHRRIIADYAIAHGFEPQHIMPGGRITPASLTPGAVMGKDLIITYPQINA